MKRPLCWILAIFLTALLTAYAGLWLYSAKWFEEEINKAYEQADKNGIRFLGEKPVLTGFPFVPQIYYAGGFQFGNVMVTFPEARLRGYPIPGLSFHLSVPRGVAIEGITDPEHASLDSIEADITIPSTFPADIHPTTLRVWQQAGGEFHIKKYTVIKGALQSDGSGRFSLDETLQPEVQLDSTVVGYQEFIQQLMQDRLIEPIPAAVAIGLMNSMATADEETGQNIVTLNVAIKNRFLTIGPLQVAQLPMIDWSDIHTLPALLQ
jgi:hypothetical protein